MQTDIMTDALLMGAVLILWLTLAAIFIKAALRKLREGNFVGCFLLVIGVAAATSVFSHYLIWAARGLWCLLQVRTTGYCSW